MHLIFGVVGVHLSGAAGVLQRLDAVAKALIGQRGEVIPPGAERVRCRPARGGPRRSAGSRQSCGRPAAPACRCRVIAGAALLLVAAEPEAKAEGVEAEAEIALLPAILAVALIVSLLVAALIITLLAVAVTAARASRPSGGRSRPW